MNNLVNVNFADNSKVTNLVDNKGTILTSTNGEDLAQLPVGSNGTVLTANSSQPTGLEWSNVSSLFGSEYNCAAANAEQSTTVLFPTLSQALRLTTTPLNGGLYRIAVFCNYRTSSNFNVTAYMRLEVDDTTTILEMNSCPIRLSGSLTTQYADFFTGFRDAYALSPGVHTFDLDYGRGDTTGGTVFIRECRIELFRVG